MLYVVITLRLKAFDAAGAAELAPRLEVAARDAGPWWKPRTLAGAAAAYLLAGDRDERCRCTGTSPTPTRCLPGSATTFSPSSGTTPASIARRDPPRRPRKGEPVAHRLEPELAAHLEVRQGRLDAALVAAAEAISSERR